MNSCSSWTCPCSEPAPAPWVKSSLAPSFRPVVAATVEPSTTSKPVPSPVGVRVNARPLVNDHGSPGEGSNRVKNSGTVASTGYPRYESPCWIGTPHAHGKLARIASYRDHSSARCGAFA